MMGLLLGAMAHSNETLSARQGLVDWRNCLSIDRSRQPILI